jgi:8-oxo-dGTP diphosphatase
VWEETGLRCRLGAELEAARYDDRKGRPKVVRYWAMEVTADEGFVPNEEVDEVRWVDPATAASLLSYEHDRLLVAAL